MRHNATTTLPTPPERIHNWLDTQLSIARLAGGMTFNGHHYTIAYDEPGQPLVRDDVLAAEAKTAKREKKRQRDEAQREAAAAQTVLRLPSEDTEGGSHD